MYKKHKNEITIRPEATKSTILNKENELVSIPYESVAKGLEIKLNITPIIPVNIPTLTTISSDLIHSTTEIPFFLVKKNIAIIINIKNHIKKPPIQIMILFYFTRV